MISLKPGILGSALVITSGFSATMAQGTGKPILVTNGREIAAFFDGAQCAEEVKLAFRARQYDHFSSEQPIAARLMNNVTNVVRRQCAAADRVIAQGYVQGDISYTGIAARETDWRVVEIGAGGSGLAAGGERKDTGGKTSFAASDGFSPGPELISQIGADSALCEAHDMVTNTCRVITIFERSLDGTPIMVARQMEDEDGMEARVSSPYSISSSGFFCVYPAAVSVAVSGGDMGDASRNAVAESLKARIEDVGDEACTGYARDGNGYVSATYDADDLALTESVPLTVFSAAAVPTLRFDK